MIDKTGETTGAAADEAAALVGTWELQLSTPFGTQPVTFTVERTGGALTGTLRHERGAAEVSDIQVRGQEFSARAALTLKGTQITADVEGRMQDVEMSGTVKVNLPVAPPVKFVGRKP